MSVRDDVPPDTVGVDLLEFGVQVEYLDGRTAVYRGVPQKTTGTLHAGPGKQTHVLVTDPTETEGVMLYVNDRKTHEDILEDSGVGRVILDPGSEEEVFPGVTVRVRGGERTEVEADPEVARGRVFVFVEDDWSEQSYEIVADEDEADAADEPENDNEDGDGDAGTAAAGADGEADADAASESASDGWIDRDADGDGDDA